MHLAPHSEPQHRLHEWVDRRQAMLVAAAWLAGTGLPVAHGQERSNVVALDGTVTCNGDAVSTQSVIQTGDIIETGPSARLVFVIGDGAFLVRPNTTLSVERGDSLHTVNLVRLLKGGVACVWQTGGLRRLATPVMHADSFGSGLYAEALTEKAQHAYCCSCFGGLRLYTSTEQKLLTGPYHDAYRFTKLRDDKVDMSHAEHVGHSDAELEFLAGLVQARTGWQELRRGASHTVG